MLLNKAACKARSLFNGLVSFFYFEYLIVKEVTTPQTQLNTKTNTGEKTPSSIPATPFLAL